MQFEPTAAPIHDRQGPLGNLLLRSSAAWLVIAAVESVHGVARTILLAPLTGDFRARQIAVFTGSALIVSIAYLFRNWMNARTLGEQIAAGTLWVVLTVAFEIALGRAMNLSWEGILSDYNISAGGLMPVGLAIMMFAPAIAARLRLRQNENNDGIDGQ